MLASKRLNRQRESRMKEQRSSGQGFKETPAGQACVVWHGFDVLEECGSAQARRRRFSTGNRLMLKIASPIPLFLNGWRLGRRGFVRSKRGQRGSADAADFARTRRKSARPKVPQAVSNTAREGSGIGVTARLSIPLVVPS